MDIIKDRLDYYKRKLDIIESTMQEEMAKRYQVRNYILLNFLAKERDTYRYVRKEVSLIESHFKKNNCK